jgi:hypothetical protein
LRPKCGGRGDLEVICRLMQPVPQVRQEHALWSEALKLAYAADWLPRRWDNILLAVLITGWDLPHKIETLLDPGQDYPRMTLTEGAMNRLPDSIRAVLLAQCQEIYRTTPHAVLQQVVAELIAI